MTFGKILLNRQQCNDLSTNNLNKKDFNQLRMKRIRCFDEVKDYEPIRKKRVYEDKMSKKLLDFHIYENQANVIAVEELDDWVVDDLNLNSTSNAIIEEPVLDDCVHSDFSNTSDQSSNGIILSEELKVYIENCKKADNFPFTNNNKTGKELVLYNQISNTSNSLPYISQSINERIVELENWKEEDENNLTNKNSFTPQIVTYPCSSSSKSSSLSNISDGTIPDVKDSNFKENLSDVDYIFLKNEDSEFENIMEID